MLIAISKVYFGQPILMTSTFIQEAQFVATNETHLVLECSPCKPIGEICSRIQNKDPKSTLIYFYRLYHHVDISCCLTSATTLCYNRSSLFMIPHECTLSESRRQVIRLPRLLKSTPVLSTYVLNVVIVLHSSFSLHYLRM